MKRLIAIRDFFIFGNVWLSLCAVAQGILTFQLMCVPISIPVCCILFLATFFIYNIRVLFLETTVSSSDSDVSVHLHWMLSHARMLWVLALVALVGIVPFAAVLSTQTIFVFFVTAVLAFFYSLPFPRKGGLRQIPGLKIFLIATVWTCSTVLIPVVESMPVRSEMDITLLWLQQFIFFFTLALLFDIRDEQTDRAHGLHTVATYLGADKTRMLCSLLLLIEAYVIFLSDYLMNQSLFVLLIVFTLLVAAVIWGSKYVKNIYYYFFIVDGMLLLQYVLVKVVL